MVSTDFLKTLRCPHCARQGCGELIAERDTWLVCQELDCGRKYPIRNGVPMVLTDEGDKWINIDLQDLPKDAMSALPNQPDPAWLARKAQELRIAILRMVINAGSGHIGGAYSVLEILTALYFRILKHDPTNPAWAGRDRGYNRFQLRDPFIAEIPWPATRRGGKIIGKEGPPRERYYLKPLDQDQITALQARPIQEYPYLEDYCFPWGYACLTPIWVTNPSIEYIESLITRRIKAKKFILIPHIEMRGMTPTTGSIPLIRNAARILRNHEPSLFLWLNFLFREQAVRPLRLVRRVLRLRRSWAPSQ